MNETTITFFETMEIQNSFVSQLRNRNRILWFHGVWLALGGIHCFLMMFTYLFCD